MYYCVINRMNIINTSSLKCFYANATTKSILINPNKSDKLFYYLIISDFKEETIETE